MYILHLSVIYGLSVNPLIINIPIDLLTDKVRQKKLPTSIHRYLHW